MVVTASNCFIFASSFIERQTNVPTTINKKTQINDWKYFYSDSISNRPLERREPYPATEAVLVPGSFAFFLFAGKKHFVGLLRLAELCAEPWRIGYMAVVYTWQVFSTRPGKIPALVPLAPHIRQPKMVKPCNCKFSGKSEVSFTTTIILSTLVPVRSRYFNLLNPLVNHNPKSELN